MTAGLGATGPPVGLIAAGATTVAGLALVARRSARLRRAGRDLLRGAAILREPGRFVGRVLPWQLGNRALRLASMWCFLQCVGLPSGIAVVLVACAAQGAGSSVPLPVANVATAAGVLIAGLPVAAGRPVDLGAVAALAVVVPVTLTLVGLALSAGLAGVLMRRRGGWRARAVPSGRPDGSAAGLSPGEVPDHARDDRARSGVGPVWPSEGPTASSASGSAR